MGWAVWTVLFLFNLMGNHAGSTSIDFPAPVKVDQRVVYHDWFGCFFLDQRAEVIVLGGEDVALLEGGQEMKRIEFNLVAWLSIMASLLLRVTSFLLPREGFLLKFVVLVWKLSSWLLVLDNLIFGVRILVIDLLNFLQVFDEIQLSITRIGGFLLFLPHYVGLHPFVHIFIKLVLVCFDPLLESPVYFGKWLVGLLADRIWETVVLSDLWFLGTILITSSHQLNMKL